MSNNPLDVFHKIPPNARFAVVGLGAAGVGYLAYSRRKSAEVAVVSDQATAPSTSLDDSSSGGYYGNGNIPIVVSGGSGASGSDTSSGSGIDPNAIVQGAFDYGQNLTDSALGFAGTMFNRYADSMDNTNNNITGSLVSLATAGSSMPAPATIVVNPLTVPAAAPAPPAPAAAPAPAVAAAPAGFPHRNKVTGEYYKNAAATSAGTDSNGNKYKKGDSLNIYSNGRVVKD